MTGTRPADATTWTSVHPRAARGASRVLAVAATAAVVLLGAACGGDAADGGPELSPEAATGRRLATAAGCASCHGANGEGNVGPAFVGLFGSERELRDGTTVIADEDYLRESIRDPSAKMVAGYSLRMPTNNLTDAEIDSIVTYIVALSSPSPEPTP